MDEKSKFLTKEELEKMSLIEIIAYKNLLRLMKEKALKKEGANDE